jgi:hypothetical protein
MAVLFVLLIVALVGWPSSVYLFHQVRRLPLGRPQLFNMYGCFLAAAAISLATWWMGMRTGIRALEALE